MALADRPVLQQHLDLAGAVGQAAGGDLGAGDGLLEDDDGQDQPHGVAQVKGFEYLPTLARRAARSSRAAPWRNC